MRIFFIGCVEFSHFALEKLLLIQNENLKIVGIATKEKSDFNADFYDLKKDAQNIPCLYSRNINDKESIEFIKKCKPDIIFCLGWSYLIKEELLKAYPIIGFHPSLLPQNRGRHPIIWALFLGLKQSGVSFFVMDKNADTGRILAQKSIKISKKDDAASLYKKSTKTALKLLEKLTLKLSQKALKNKNFKELLRKLSTPQSAGNAWRKRDFKDGIIDFRMSTEAIYNLIRALTHPYIGAEFIYKGKNYKVYKAKIIKNSQKNLECGKVLKADKKGILIKTYDGAILLYEHTLNDLPKKDEYL
ncbi:formyltransferase family protein [Campylobacter sp. US33a]|uniref:formyltransferase family protein n=1 Tax=Campylobacter sp. US33a TaxID=2498120 RepID=UPI0010686952|nr:formyltransferase family protein [Campylobacter sp. US33a]TEY02797.1 methionyl-tRNA formyltransferase [Campylobacter sp. US33a]